MPTGPRGRQAAIERVRIVVIDHNGGPLTARCLESLAATTWPGRCEIVVVDNASTPPVPQELGTRPNIRIVRSDMNRGFAGGANLGIGDLTGVDAVALINNDATVAPDWLDPLVTALDGDPGLGAAGPKIRFTGRYLAVDIASPAARGQRLDRRRLGVRLHDVRSPAGAFHLAKGFWGPELDDDGRTFEWTEGSSRLYVRVDGSPRTDVGLLLSAVEGTKAILDAGQGRAEVCVGDEPRWFSVTAAGEPFPVINNVGTVLGPDWYGADRGYLQPDRGQFDHAEEIEAWCGGAVLLRAGYLRSVGTFDERLFLYYEDLELSLRGRRSGWRYRLVPESIVDHDHSATAISGSDLAEFYKERNRLIVMARYAPWTSTVSQLVRFVFSTLSYAWRDIAVALVNRHRSRGGIVRRRVQSLASFVTTEVSAGHRCRRRR